MRTKKADSRPNKVLIIRFSAMGDVAMTLPVLNSVCRKYNDCEFTFLTNIKFAPLFCSMPTNFHFLGVDLHKDYNGLSGLRKLIKKLKSKDYDTIADLHNVLRSLFISLSLRFHVRHIRHIRKFRLRRWKLTRRLFKSHKPLPSAFDRYNQVFVQLGFDNEILFNGISIQPEQQQYVNKIIGISANTTCIGIAPFAAHKSKVYPLNLMKEVVSNLNNIPDIKIFIFAYGTDYNSIISWQQQYNSIHFIHGQLNLEEELSLISTFKLMISMDSANMHLASLLAIPVVSIWGATHPLGGYNGFGQDINNCIQADMNCRPCSMYGKKKCFFGDYRCLSCISPQSISDHVRYLLKKK